MIHIQNFLVQGLKNSEWYDLDYDCFGGSYFAKDNHFFINQDVPCIEYNGSHEMGEFKCVHF